MLLTLYKTRDDWLAGRGIGASEVAAILGLSPYAKPFDIYARHRLGYVQPDNPDMAAGRAWEHPILVWYGDQEEVEVVGPRDMEAEGWRCCKKDADWATCSPDGLVVVPGYEASYTPDSVSLKPLWGVEAKRSRVPRDWGEPGEIPAGATDLPIPAAYYTQCLWSMLVTGLDRWVLVAQVLGDGRIYQVHADPARQAALFARVAEWRERFVLGDEVPAVDGSDGADYWLRECYPTGATRREATPEEVALAREYATVTASAKELEERKRLLSQQLRCRRRPGGAGPSERAGEYREGEGAHDSGQQAAASRGARDLHSVRPVGRALPFRESHHQRGNLT